MYLKSIEASPDKEYNLVKEKPHNNFDEHGTNKEGLNLATEAIRDLGRIRYSLSSSGGKMDWDGIRTIAKGISTEFIRKGYIDLRRQKINYSVER